MDRVKRAIRLRLRRCQAQGGATPDTAWLMGRARGRSLGNLHRAVC
jgi:hypothetical protein